MIQIEKKVKNKFSDLSDHRFDISILESDARDLFIMPAKNLRHLRRNFQLLQRTYFKTPFTTYPDPFMGCTRRESPEQETKE